MRITMGSYKGLTAEELVERDPGYAEWFWQHATNVPMALGRKSGRCWQNSGSPVSRTSTTGRREIEGMKRQQAEERALGPSADEVNFEKLRADGLQKELAEACRLLADKDREMEAVKEVFKKLRVEYARTDARPAVTGFADDCQTVGRIVQRSVLQVQRHSDRGFGLCRGSTS